MSKSLRNTSINVKVNVDSKGLDHADKKIKEAINTAGEFENATKKTGKAVDNTGKSLIEASKAAEKNSNSLKNQKSSAEGSAKAVERLSKSSNLLKDSLSSIGAAAAVKGLYNLGKAAIQTGMDFDEGMAAVKAVSGASAKDFETMRKQAIQLGADTTKSAKEVSEGQLELAKSGMSAKQAMAAIPGVINASTASGEDMAVATSVMTSALNGFSLKASESAHVADVLAMAANKSKADINDMGYAFKYAAAPANTLGMSLEQVSAATMVMVDSGMAGEQAGTSLRSALISLASPSKAASKEMNALGLKITDAKGNMRPFSKIMDDLRDSTKGMGNAQKLAAVSTIFGTEAASGMVKIIDTAPGTLDKYTEALKRSDGEAKKASDTMNNTLSGSMKNLEGTFESIKINVSDVLTPSLRKGVDAVADLGDGFNDLSPSAKSMAVWGTVIVGGVVPASIAIHKVRKAVKSVREVMGGAKSFFTNYRTEMQLTGAQAATTAKQIETMNAAMNGGGTTTKGGKKGKSGGSVGTMVVSTGKNGLGKVNSKTGMLKNTLGQSAKLGKKIPVIGTAIGIGALAMGGKENLGSNAGSLGGGAAGAAAGAALGSVIPGVGTAIGGTIGGIAGSYFGEKFGASAQKSLSKESTKYKASALSTGIDFGKGVSKGTSKAINQYENLNDKATEQLNSLKWSGKKISQDTAKSLKDTYGKMSDSIADSMQTNFGKSSKIISKSLKNSGLSKKEQNSILKDMKESHKKQKEQVEKAQKEINKILSKASKEKRKLTKDEQKDINKYQKQMNSAAVRTMSKSAKEQRTIMTELKNDSGKISAKQAADVVKQSKKARDGAKKAAEDKYRKVLAAADSEYKDQGAISESQYNKIIKEAKKTRNDAIDHAEKMHEGVVKQAKQQAKGHISAVDWETGKTLTAFQQWGRDVSKQHETVIKIINGVLKFVGKDPIPLYSTSAKASVQNKVVNNRGNSIASNATGTNYHPGGASVVGEEGPELAYTPYGGARLLGQNGAEIVDLPRGAKVLTASQTAQMMSGGLKGTMPGYAKGTGTSLKEAAGDVMSFITNPIKSAKEVFNRYGRNIKNDIGYDRNLGLSIFQKLGGEVGASLKEKVADFMDFGGASGAGSESAKKWILSAMAITNTPASYLNGLMTIAKRESGFNPKAINLWDSNAKAGHPSQGLFQTIPSTFAAYRNKSLPNDITNPIANAVAAINYMNSRYGGIGNVPGLKNLASGKGYVGYKKGGFKNNHDKRVLVGEEGPELVDLPFGSRVHNNRKTNDILRNNQNNAPIIIQNTFNIEGGGNNTGLTKSQVEKMFNEMMGKMFKDMRGLFDSGIAY